MSQDSSYRWEQAYEAHKASGLTIREFHRTRAAEFCDGSYLPTYVTMTVNGHQKLTHFGRAKLAHQNEPSCISMGRRRG